MPPTNHHLHQRKIHASITSSSSLAKRRSERSSTSLSSHRWSRFSQRRKILVVAIVLLVTFQLWISLTHQPIPNLMDRFSDTDKDEGTTQTATIPDNEILTMTSPATTIATSETSKHRRQESNFRQWRHEWKPRVVFCGGGDDDPSTYTTKNESSSSLPSLKFSDNIASDNTNVRTVEPLGGPCPYCEHEPDYHVWPFELPFSEQCTPMVPWQTTFHPVSL